jgi:hypothetical protein
MGPRHVYCRKVKTLRRRNGVGYHSHGHHSVLLGWHPAGLGYERHTERGIESDGVRVSQRGWPMD